MSRRKVTSAKEFRKAMMDIGLEKTKEIMVLVIKKLSLDTYKNVTDFSAVEFGYLKGNWGVEVDEDPPDDVEPDPEKGRIYPEPEDPGLNEIKYDSRVVLYNNTSYGPYLEETQPMVFPAEQALFFEAEKLVNSLSNKKLE